MKYVLGIDGGGSKLEFCLADLHGNTVESFRIDKGCNPWNVGVDTCLMLVHEGLAHFAAYQQDVVQIVAGIAGMFGHNQYSDAVRGALETYCPKTLLTGDLPTSFRAGTDQKVGIIAISGTGSSVALVRSDGELVVNDGVGASGREISGAIAFAYRRGNLGTAGAAFIKKHAPILDTPNLTIHEQYHNDSVKMISKQVAALSETSQEFKDVQIFLDTAIDRWRYKLYGFTKLFQQLEPDANVIPIVLNGSVWNFDYIRHNVTEPLTNELPGIEFVFDRDIHPVHGAVHMAIDLYKAEV